MQIKLNKAKNLRYFLVRKLMTLGTMLLLAIIIIAILQSLAIYNVNKLSTYYSPLQTKLVNIKENIDNNFILTQLLLSKLQQNIPQSNIVKNQITLESTLRNDIKELKEDITTLDKTNASTKLTNAYYQYEWSLWKILDIANMKLNYLNEQSYERIIKEYRRIKSMIQAKPNYELLVNLLDLQQGFSKLYIDQKMKNMITLKNRINRFEKSTAALEANTNYQQSLKIQTSRYIYLIKTYIGKVASYKKQYLYQEMITNYTPNYYILKKAIQNAINLNRTTTSKITAEIYWLNAITITVAILGFVAGIFIGFNTVRKILAVIIAPIETLTQNMLDISKGKNRVTHIPTHVLELQNLYNSIKEMVEQRLNVEKILRKNEKSLAFLAYHNIDTGIYNNQYFEKQLKNSVFKAYEAHKDTNVVVFHIQIYNLETLDNILGIKATNQLLAEFAKQIINANSKEVILAQTTQDTFAGYFITTPKFKAKKYFEDFLQNMPKSLTKNDLEFKIDFAMGVSICENKRTIISKIIEEARFAAITARENKQRIKIYDRSDEIKLARRAILENDVYTAIERRQIFLLYQPQINLKTNQIVGYEALVRWQHPDYGLISPDEFIPILEKNQLILKYGKYIQQIAITDWKKLHKATKAKLKLAINASILELTSSEYLSNLKLLLKANKIPNKFVEIEATESFFSTKAFVLKSVIKKIRKSGISVAIDDFGTGYSSLDRIKDIAVDLIKIDKAFLVKTLTDEKATKLLRTIIQLSKILKAKTLIEGAETKHDIELVKDLGCDFAQGFYYSKPLHIKDLIKYTQMNDLIS